MGEKKGSPQPCLHLEARGVCCTLLRVAGDNQGRCKQSPFLYFDTFWLLPTPLRSSLAILPSLLHAPQGLLSAIHRDKTVKISRHAYIIYLELLQLCISTTDYSNTEPQNP